MEGVGSTTGIGQIEFYELPPTTHPDLEVGTPTVDDDSPETGGSFTLSATVNNTGDAESAATTLRYYRSTDATITSSDTEVGTDAIGVLAASGTSDQSIDLTAPSTTGVVYYGACVDCGNGRVGHHGQLLGLGKSGCRRFNATSADDPSRPGGGNTDGGR